MTTHRSWFPFILLGLSTALLALIVVVYNPNATLESDSAPVVVAPTGTEYEAAVRTIVTTYVASSDSEADKAAYDALLEMRVPEAYKTVHISLVLAFGQFAVGEDQDGDARLSDIITTNPWILGL